MGIDGIGGKPPATPGVGLQGPAGPGGEAFSVQRSSGADAAQGVADVASTDALDRLRAGELSLDEYLDTRVEKAVAHLAHLLPPDQLDQIKEQLKEQLQNDPSAGTLLQRATGLLNVDEAFGSAAGSSSDADLDKNG